MRNKVVTAIVAGLTMAGMSSVGFTQAIPAQPERPGAGVESTASAKRAQGEVTSVDAKAGKLAVRTDDRELNLNVQASAAKKSLESIKIGDKVNVSYRDQSGILIADAVSKAGAGGGEGASQKAR
jgi:Cu/Ag efflux protein CusF